jgi:hypothetical protein
MNALLQKKREWEYQNREVLVRLVRTSSDVSVESVKKAGLLTSFLLYLVYQMIKGMLVVGGAVTGALLRGPQLVRQVAPEYRPEECYEFNQTQLEESLKSIRLKY